MVQPGFPNRKNRKFLEHSFCKALLFASVMGGISCGGGGGGSSSSSPGGDFSLAINPSSSIITAGGSSTLTVSVTATNGFSTQVSVQVSGMPAGVSVTPATITVSPGTPQKLAIAATATASPGNANLTFTGTAGSLSHTAQLSLTVDAPPVLVRTRYVRTDRKTPIYDFINTHWLVYNLPTNRFFVADPFTNHVFVLDAATEQQIATIDVPGAFALDQTLDQTGLWVGTQIGDVYTIDPVAMRVTKRYISSQIGPFGFQAFAALPLADGRVSLLGGQGGIPAVDGYSSFAIWNPADNSITIYATPYSAGNFVFSNIPYTVVCAGPDTTNIFAFFLSTDRKSIFIGSGGVCLLDTVSGQTQLISPLGSVGAMVLSPDGNLLVVPDFGQSRIFVYDAHTLNLKSQFPVIGGPFFSASLLVSRDSQTLYLEAGSIIYAYSLVTQQQVGWFSGLYLSASSGCSPCSGPVDTPYMLAIDNSGLIAGPMEQGVGFLDSATMRTGPVGPPGTQYLNAYLNPAFGPVSGGTSLQWSVPSPTNGNFSAVFFGSRPAANFSYSSSSGFMNATTPPGKAGPVDVYAYGADGSVEIVPEAFSYGPWILQGTNASTVEGGGQGALYGYGFGTGFASSSSGIPPDLQITVGGKPATITSYRAVADGLLSPPFLLQAVLFTMPSGNSGLADITVTNTSGSMTLSGGLTYLPAVQKFPNGTMSLAQGIYDPHRDVYYFTDADRIQVFSRTQGKWLSPIALPGQRLWGISLSPDGSKLAVGDYTGGKIYVLGPDNPASQQSFTIPVPIAGTVVGPAGLAISDAGMVYFATYVYGGTGFNNFFKLDTTTSKITDYGISGPGLGYSDANLRMVLTSDNARAYFNDDGELYSIDTATDRVTFALDGPHCCYGDYDLTLSSNESNLFATGYFFDTDMNGLSSIGLNHREELDVSYLYGAKLSPDGSLLFQPTTTGIDVYDGHVGTLRSRISLPVQLSAGFDSLVVNGKDNVLIAITGQQGSGIAVIDLTSLTEPPPFLATSATDASSWFHLSMIPKLGTAVSFSYGRPPRQEAKHVTYETPKAEFR